MARKALNVSLQLLDTDKKISKEIRDILAKKFKEIKNSKFKSGILAHLKR